MMDVPGAEGTRHVAAQQSCACEVPRRGVRPLMSQGPRTLTCVRPDLLTPQGATDAYRFKGAFEGTAGDKYRQDPMMQGGYDAVLALSSTPAPGRFARRSPGHPQCGGASARRDSART